jgi:Mor family transcriptional regulator
MNTAIQRVLDLLYHGTPRPTKPVLPEYLSKSELNEQIRARYATGESIADLAREYEISDQHVFQILHPEPK